jgi:RNA polymerase sigma-70 factor (ECF subfamily)
MAESINAASGARELAARILTGDPEAEIELFRRYGPTVMRMLQAITHNIWTAEDVHQETFAIVLRRLRNRPLDDPDNLLQFVRQTARKLLMVANRKKRRRLETEVEGAVLEELVDPQPGQLFHLLRNEEREQVRRAVAGVRPVRYRQLLHRYYLDEEAKENICRDMGLTAVHFNRVLFRARRQFLLVVSRNARQQAIPVRRVSDSRQ